MWDWTSFTEADDLDEVPSLDAWIYAQCDPLSEEEFAWWATADPQTDFERRLLDELGRRYIEYGACRSLAYARARDSLEPLNVPWIPPRGDRIEQ